MHNRARFAASRSYHCWYGDFSFFKMASVRHLGFLLHIFGPPTKSIWWS